MRRFAAVVTVVVLCLAFGVAQTPRRVAVHAGHLLDVKSGKTLWSGLAKTDGPRVKGRLLDGLREAYDQADKIRYKR